MANEKLKTLSKEIRSVRVDVALQEISEYIASRASANDNFFGYSLLEAISDRIDIIGSLADSQDLFDTKTDEGKAQQLSVNRYGTPTKQAQLLALKERGLQAIASARELNSETLAQIEEDSEGPQPIDKEGTVYA